MALIKYCAGFAALVTLAAAAPTPQFSGGIQNDVVNVVKTDNDVDVDYDYDGHDKWDHHHYDHYHNVDPDPLHHVYYDTHHKRNGGDGLLNDLVDANIGSDNQDESSHYHFEDHHDHHDDHYYGHDDHYWKKRNGGDGILNDLLDANIGEGNQDESSHFSSHGWKRDAAPQFSGGIQNDVTNVVDTDNDVDVDVDYDDHHGKWDHHDHHYEEHYHNVDPDPLHHVYYETHGWKRDAAPQFSGGIQNDVTNVVKTDNDVDVDVDYDDDHHKGHHGHDDYDEYFHYWASQDPDPKHKYYPDGHWHKE